MTKRALIFGISGQDGTLLTKHLLQMGYEVHGTSRDVGANVFAGLRSLGLYDRVKLHSAILTDFRSIARAIDAVRPHEIYNLAGQTSVQFSFTQPVEAVESIVTGCLNILEAVRFLKLHDCCIFNASSVECFGNQSGPLDEQSAFRPVSPYAVAKTAAHNLTTNYRNAYGIRTCSGILSNHESLLRSERFVTMKIVRAAERISRGEMSELQLGNVEIIRDWGWAEDYVTAMHLMLQQDTLDDYIIATGKSIALREFATIVFDKYGLNGEDYIVADPALCRPSDIAMSLVNPSKIVDNIGWQADSDVFEVIDKLTYDTLSSKN